MKIKGLGIAAVMVGALGMQVAMAGDNRDLLTVAKSKPQFSTLASVIESAGLAETLQNGKDFTLFAPTNDAFAKLAPADLEALTKPENKDKLIAVLTHHLVEGKGRTGDDLRRKRAFRSVQGSDINMKLERGKLLADGARVGREFDARNGTIFAIDHVMMPN